MERGGADGQTQRGNWQRGAGTVSTASTCEMIDDRNDGENGDHSTRQQLQLETAELQKDEMNNCVTDAISC